MTRRTRPSCSLSASWSRWVSPADDDLLSGFVDVAGVDRPVAVSSALVAEAGLRGQCVDQPRLTLRLCPDFPQGILGERLSRVLRVLVEQRRDFGAREVPETQRLRLDVERTPAGDDFPCGARVDAVVPHVTNAAQDNALRKARRAPVVSRPKLSQHRQQRIAHQGIDLVDEQHQGSRIGLRPTAQDLLERAIGSKAVEDVEPDPVHEVVPECEPGPGGQLAEDRAHRPLGVFAPGLSGLDVRVYAAVVTRDTAVQQVLQRQQHGSLACLTRRMQNEVALVADQREHVAEIQPFQRRDSIVIRCNDGAGGVEEAHGRRNHRVTACSIAVKVRHNVSISRPRGVRQHGCTGDACVNFQAPVSQCR